MRNGLKHYVPEFLRSVFPVVAGFAAVLLVYAPTSRLLVNAWNNEEAQSHGWLVLILSAWLVWRHARSHRIRLAGPSGLTLVISAIAGVLWVLAYVSAILAVQSLAMIAILYCVVTGTFSGSRRAGFILPVGILVFTLPLWSLLTPALQSLTILFVSSVLSVLGWTAYLVGDVIHVSAGSFRIAEGCGGTHFLVVALIISFVYAHLYIRARAAQALFVVSAVVLAIVSNWVRVLTLVIVGDVSDMEHYLIAVDHYYFGWLVFGVALVPVFLIGSRLQDFDERKSHASLKQASDTESAESAAVNNETSRWPTICRNIALALLAVLPPLVGITLASRDANEFSAVRVPEFMDTWRLSSPDAIPGLPQPLFPGAQSSITVTYEESGRQIQLYLNKFVSQRHGAELIGAGNKWYALDWYAYSALRWEAASSELPAEFFVEEVRRGPARTIVFHAYLIGPRLIASEVNAKLRETVNAVTGDVVSGAVAVYVPCEASCDAAVEYGRDFLMKNIGDIVNSIRPGEVT